MIYLDANFFIFAAFDAGKKGDHARMILAEIIHGRKAVTSALAIDEVMWVFKRNKFAGNLRSTVEEIYTIRNLEVKEVSALIPIRALDFIERFALKPRDAFHASIMSELGITDIVSDDSDFDKISGLKRIVV